VLGFLDRAKKVLLCTGAMHTTFSSELVIRLPEAPVSVEGR
jgi:hypothetical protein